MRYLCLTCDAVEDDASGADLRTLDATENRRAPYERSSFQVKNGVQCESCLGLFHAPCQSASSPGFKCVTCQDDKGISSKNGALMPLAALSYLRGSDLSRREEQRWAKMADSVWRVESREVSFCSSCGETSLGSNEQFVCAGSGRLHHLSCLVRWQDMSSGGRLLPGKRKKRRKQRSCESCASHKEESENAGSLVVKKDSACGLLSTTPAFFLVSNSGMPGSSASLEVHPFEACPTCERLFIHGYVSEDGCRRCAPPVASAADASDASSGPLEVVTMVICDGCESEFELPAGEAVPSGDWFCAECSSSNAKRRKVAEDSASGTPAPTKRNRKPKETAAMSSPIKSEESVAPLVAETLLICDGCESEFAMSEMSLTRVPDGDWYCVACTSHRASASKDPPLKPEPSATSGGRGKKKGSGKASSASGKVKEENFNIPLRKFGMEQWLPQPVVVTSTKSWNMDAAAKKASKSSQTNVIQVENEMVDASGNEEEQPKAEQESVVIVCDQCLQEFPLDAASDISEEGESAKVPPRPWYCAPCLRQLKKSRKRRQRFSKQMLLEMQLYGGLLRPTAEKVEDPDLKALRADPPTSFHETKDMFSLVGSNVGIFHKPEKLWAWGRVLCFDFQEKTHLVRFEDGTQQSLPLHALPLAMGTGIFCRAGLPGDSSHAGAGEIMKLNALGRKVLFGSQVEKEVNASRHFRLVHVFASCRAVGGKEGEVGNCLWWLPKYMCQALDVDEIAEGERQARDQVKELTMQTLRGRVEQEDVVARLNRAVVGIQVRLHRDDRKAVVKSYQEDKGQHVLSLINDEGPSTASDEIDVSANLSEWTFVDFADAATRVCFSLADESITAGKLPDAVLSTLSNKPSCDACGLPCRPTVDVMDEGDASMVQCENCCKAFHQSCSDPPLDFFQVLDDENQVLYEDKSSSFVCSECTVCAGCRSSESGGAFGRWRLPLSAVSVCSSCLPKYEGGVFCSVCYFALSEEEMFSAGLRLLGCSNCHLWTHAECEPDPSLSFHPSRLDRSFQLPFSTEPATQGTSVTTEASTSASSDASLKEGKQRKKDEAFAMDLRFDEDYDYSTWQDYECPTCRSLRILRTLSRLLQEDKMDLFKDPVTEQIAPTYFDVIKQPMDLSTMQRKAMRREYGLASFRDFRDDFELLCLNAVTFNSRERDFLIWREAWRFYGQGQKILRQSCPKTNMKQRGGKFYDQLVTAAKRQLPNNSLIGKQSVDIGGAGDSTTVARMDGKAQEGREEGDDGKQSSVEEAQKEELVEMNGEQPSSKATKENRPKESTAAPPTPSKAEQPMRSVPLPTLQTSLPESKGLTSKVELYEVQQSREESHLNSSLDLCLKCGSAGLSDQLLFCVDCAEAFHWFCLPGMTAEKLATVDHGFWRCPNCKLCEVCSESGTEEALRSLGDGFYDCHSCFRGFHGSCLSPSLELSSTKLELQENENFQKKLGETARLMAEQTVLHCSRCVGSCRKCHRRLGLRDYSYDKSLCLACSKAALTDSNVLGGSKKGNKELVQIWNADSRKQRQGMDKCPLCDQKWDVGSSELMQCDACERWIHPACDSLLVNDHSTYEKLVSDSDALYICASCRPQERSYLLAGADGGVATEQESSQETWKLALLTTRIQSIRSQSRGKWREIQSQVAQNRQYDVWRQYVPVYLYVLRLGEERLKLMALNCAGMRSQWRQRLTSLKVSDELLAKATRYLRFKRYCKGPRAFLRRQRRKESQFYSSVGMSVRDKSSVGTMVMEATNCACFLVCQELMDGARNRLSPAVLHLAELNRKPLPEGVATSLAKGGAENLEEEVRIICEQYEQRVRQKQEQRAKEEGKTSEGKREISQAATEQDVLPPHLRLNRAEPLVVETDQRSCILCFLIGDNTLCGRLLPMELDQWAHVQCLLWSSDVSEDKSLLLKCQRAKHKSKQQRCEECGLMGATVGCSVSRCPKRFHFACALSRQVVFLPNGDCCCTDASHLQQTARKWLHQDQSLYSSVLDEGRVEETNGTAHDSRQDGREDAGSECAQPSTNGTPDTTATEEEQKDEGALEPSPDPTDKQSTASETEEEPNTLQVTLKYFTPTTHGVEGLAAIDPTVEPQRCLRSDVSFLEPDPKKKSQSLRAKRQLCLRFGALAVHNLGRIVVGNYHFHSKDDLYPLGFRSSRLYWSTRHAGARCVYECTISSTDRENIFLADGGDQFPRPVFRIEASDDRENPIATLSLDQALLTLRSRLISLYDDVISTGSRFPNPFEQRKSWKAFGLQASSFFGLSYPGVRRELESLPFASTAAINRSILTKRHRSLRNLPLTPHQKKQAEEEETYVFKEVLPSQSSLLDSQRTIEQIVGGDERKKESSGSARVDGFHIVASKRNKLTRLSRQQLSEVIESPAAGAADLETKGGGLAMDVEHLPVAMQYRELRKRPFSERLEVKKSPIHGYGLFTKEKVAEGQMIVEYQGQKVSIALADEREKVYEEKGLGSCYMFRLDESTIIDATQCGNLARFINHSCDPKAFARVVNVGNNDKKIIIFAKRAIDAGDEVTYDYKFPIEDEAIRCDCGAPNCVGRMN